MSAWPESSLPWADEEVAARAIGGVGEVVGLRLVAIQAARSCRLLFSVRLVAVAAAVVLPGRVQASQAPSLMTARAGGRPAHALGAVRSVAIAAGGGELPMRRLPLFRVAVGAGRAARRSAVRRVTALAVLVALGRTAVLGLMTGPTLLELGSGVRFVAALACLVTANGFALLLLMARITAQEQGFGPMRQSAMAVGARRMARQRQCLAGVIGMAARAQAGVLRRQQEVMRRVTLAATDALMTKRFVRRFLVAKGAIAHLVQCPG